MVIYVYGTRALVIDKLVNDYIKNHEDAVIIHIGCGLDSRCLRVNQDYSLWYDVDFDNTIKSIDGNKIDDNINKLIDYVIQFRGGYLNIHLYYFENLLHVYINTNYNNLIKRLKDKYKFTIINEKSNMYHFIVK